MSNRQKIEQLRREVSVDYAFGVGGLLVVADAVDELTARVAALEGEVCRHQSQHPVEPAQDAAIVSALDDLGGKIEQLAKSIKRIRRR
jgi:outer membrane murein-binding lipoprotein Lpp